MAQPVPQQQQQELPPVPEDVVALLTREKHKSLRYGNVGRYGMMVDKAHMAHPEIHDAQVREEKQRDAAIQQQLLAKVPLTAEEDSALAFMQFLYDDRDERADHHQYAKQVVTEFVQENQELAERAGVAEGKAENMHPVGDGLLRAFFEWNFSQLGGPRYSYKTCKGIVSDVRAWEFQNLELAFIVRSSRALWRMADVEKSLFEIWQDAGRPRGGSEPQLTQKPTRKSSKKTARNRTEAAEQADEGASDAKRRRTATQWGRPLSSSPVRRLPTNHCK